MRATALRSVAVVIVSCAYLLVTVPLLLRRLRGLPQSPAGRFSLGRFGLPVNALAVLYGAFMVLNMGWPRSEVYDPAGGHWYLKYFALLFCAAVGLIGWLMYRTVNASRTTASAAKPAVVIGEAALEGAE